MEEDETFEDPRNRSLKRRFTDLYRSLADVQYDREQLGQQLDETNEKVYQLVTSTRTQLAELEQEVLNKLERLVNSQHSSIQHKLEGALQDLSQRIESHFSHIAPPQDGASRPGRAIGLVMRFEPGKADVGATPSDSTGASVREYIVPMAPTATVRQCKVEFLKRLIAAKVISDKLKESDTVCLLNKTQLFEDDTLEWILATDRHVVLTLRVKG
ncbi:hypothetical protein STCU_10623 [Strigomonas culicis]|uniref:Ubiquitin-like domain-containing protein n=1 Tax=Strigomonas culicis TaxID=28005 RepID=S9US54_9TRYP|nr:hypothetical protein STCU_10623 [Strigomonas culicis]|eukprot:EPY17431.1 hypothetical protein STCU_10623 [Strigomonas culicis]